MRVLHVIPAVAARYGGPSEAIAPMCAALNRRGIDTLTLTTSADGPRALDVALAQPTTWKGTPALFFERNLSEAFKYSRRLASWARAHTREFDIVHVHGALSHAPLAAAAAARHSSVPYIVRPLGTLASWSLGEKPWRKRLLLALGAQRMLQRATAIHCTSDEERDDVRARLGLSQGVVIPLGVDVVPGDETAVGPDRAPVVLFMSRLHPKKQVARLIDAFAAARARIAPAWTLVIAGDGDAEYVATLKAHAARVAGDAIEFAGWVSGDRRRELLNRAALFALPSEHENFGLAALEAMAAGVPVVLSPRVELAGAVISAGAGWISRTDGAALAETLADAMADAEMRRRRGAAARQLAGGYSWDRVAERLEILYREAVARPRVNGSPQRVNH